MKMQLKACSECGQLFSAFEEIHRCSSCLESEHAVYARIEEAVLVKGYSTVGEIAEALGVDAKTVKRVLKDLPTVAARIENDEMCASCRAHPKKHGFNFCTICLVNLDADFRDSKELLTRQIEERDRRPEARFRGTSVSAAIKEKRRRAGHHRADSVPKNVKGGG